MESDYRSQLKKVFKIQKTIQDIHPFLEEVFPIAIAEEGQFLIYDVQAPGGKFALVKRAAAPMAVPAGVRAAFPLDCFDNRCVCVVTGEVFEAPDGYVTIFHEFMHCQQWESCEQAIKQTLGIARKAQAANDYAWEINHPFPYSAPGFARAYAAFLAAQGMGEVSAIRKQLKALLSAEDYEYMIWQEWKEGFARYIENRIRQRLGLAENHGGKEPPYQRVTFYEGGEHYIEILSAHEAGLEEDMVNLFQRMVRGF